jgi:hypothetical protein
MKFPTLIAFLICTICSTHPVCGQHSKHLKDSVVTSHLIDYEADTISHVADQVIRYRNGNEIYNLTVGFDGKKWSDSALIQTTYNSVGEKIKVTKKIVYYGECESPARSYRDEANPWDPGYFSDSIIPGVIYPCPSRYNSTTNFSSDMAITYSSYRRGMDSTFEIDTAFYFANHLIKTFVKYPNGKFRSRVDYDYKFDKDGVVSEYKIVQHGEATNRTSITRNIYRGKDTIPFYMFGYEVDDTTKNSCALWIYNDKFQQTGFKRWQDGKLIAFITISYTDDGYQKESISYQADSTINAHFKYWWKRSGGTTEYWSCLEYSGNGMSEYNGNGYNRYDTLRTLGKTIVHSYTAKCPGKPEEQISPPLSKCPPFDYLIFDKHNRLIYQKNYQDKPGKVSYFATFKYSWEKASSE